MYKEIKRWETLYGHVAIVYMYKSGEMQGYIGVRPDSDLHGHYLENTENVPPEEFLNEDGKKFYKIKQALSEVTVHGGITYTDEGDEDEDLTYWFYGFNTSHSGDKQSKEEALKYFTTDEEIEAVESHFKLYNRLYQFPEYTYKGLDYVVFECESLSKQLAAIEDKFKDTK